MIRFIDLTNQIYDDDGRVFAWYNTATDVFMSFDYQQTFDSWGEFEIHYHQAPRGYPLKRFRKLFPW